MYEVEISANFDTEEEAKKALSDMEDAVSKNNGEIIDSWVGGDEDV